MEITILKDQIITAIDGMVKGSGEIKITLEDGRIFRFWHCQDCCEVVLVDDVVGDPNDLIGVPLVDIREETNSGENKAECDTFTWTFYKFATIKGSVAVRWYGTSNGYYSESVDFEEITSNV